MISVICPSRGRPELAERMINSLSRSPGCPIEIKLYLNDNDPALPQYIERLSPDNYIVGEDRSPVFSWNQLAFAAKYDIIFLMGDDAQIDTDNWGLEVISEFDKVPDKILMVSPKAGTLGKWKCPHFFLHKNWIKALGFYVPLFFHHHYIDFYVRDIASSIHRYRHLEHVVMPIMYNVGDDTINRYTGSWLKTRDEDLWNLCNRYKSADAAILQKFIDNYKEQ